VRQPGDHGAHRTPGHRRQVAMHLQKISIALSLNPTETLWRT